MVGYDGNLLEDIDPNDTTRIALIWTMDDTKGINSTLRSLYRAIMVNWAHSTGGGPGSYEGYED